MPSYIVTMREVFTTDYYIEVESQDKLREMELSEIVKAAYAHESTGEEREVFDTELLT